MHKKAAEKNKPAKEVSSFSKSEGERRGSKKDSNNPKSSIKQEGKKKTVKQGSSKTSICVPGTSNKRRRKDRSLKPIVHCDDVAIPDMKAHDLVMIGREAGVEQYSEGKLSDDTGDFSIEGRIICNNRMVLPLVVQAGPKGKGRKGLNVWFMLDTGSRITYLSEDSMKNLFMTEAQDSGQYEVVIQLKNNRIWANFAKQLEKVEGINLLGMDAMERLNASINIDWDNKSFELICRQQILK